MILQNQIYSTDSPQWTFFSALSVSYISLSKILPSLLSFLLPCFTEENLQIDSQRDEYQFKTSQQKASSLFDSTPNVTKNPFSSLPNSTICFKLNKKSIQRCRKKQKNPFRWFESDFREIEHVFRFYQECVVNDGKCLKEMWGEVFLVSYKGIEGRCKQNCNLEMWCLKCKKIIVRIKRDRSGKWRVFIFEINELMNLWNRNEINVKVLWKKVLKFFWLERRHVRAYLLRFF